MTRRALFVASGAAVAGAAALKAAQGARVKLGYDAYSIRDLKWKALQHIDYAASLKLDMIQISVPGDFESLDDAHLEKVKAHAAEKAIELSLATGCICPTAPSWNPANGTPEAYLARGGVVANKLGVKSLRVFIAAPTDRHSKTPTDVPPIQKHLDATLKVLRLARARMMDLGVKVIIENHADVTARELRQLVETAGKDFVGVNYDSGNPMWVMEDPEQALEVLAPYTEISHFRDSALFEHPRGAAFQWVAMGDGSVDVDKTARRYLELCPGKPVLLEIITGRPPQMLPYLEDQWWNGFRTMPAADFARFVGLVKRGHAYLGPMVIATPGTKHPDAVVAALREQQRTDLERSLAYCKEKLGLGTKL